jgi:succinoglycan biosynthesis transport protein ExoP
MERGMTADQVLSALWRRKALVGAIAVAIFAVGAGFVAAIPSVYTATVVVRVEPQRPTPEMVQHTVSELVEQRLLTVRQELLARPVLERVIREMNLYPETVSKYGIEVAVARMRKDLDVKVEGETAFELSSSASDPEVAAKVANRLPEVFAEETQKIRQAQAARATGLFADEMKELKEALSGWEKKIAQFKVDHIGELPEQMEINMRALERVGAQLTAQSEELRVAEARRSELVRAHHGMDTELGRIEAAETEMVRQQVVAQAQWTKDHPEVQRLNHELEGIKARKAEAESRLVAEREERARVNEVIARIEQEIAGLQKQAEIFQARLDNTPRWAHELSVMQNDYDVVKAKYQSVVGRKVEAELAQELEARSAKTLFNVISPAGPPAFPAKPDRMTGFLIAFLAALGIAALTGIVLEMRDDSIRDTVELKEQLPIPVLAVVPNMQGKTEKRVLTPARNTVSPSSLN